MTVRQAISSALGLLSRRDRRLLSLSVLLQMMTSLLDLAGVFLLGLVGALSVTVVQSQPPPQFISQTASVVGLGSLSGQDLVIVIASIAAGLLLIKSALSTLLNRRIFIFLANRQALVSARLAKALLARPILDLHNRSSQETSFALIQGVGAATITILGQLTVLITEGSLLLALSIGLMLVDPLLTVASIAFFAALALLLQRAMGRWATRASAVAASMEIASLNTVQEAIAAYREIAVLDRRSFYVDEIQAQRWRAAKSAADRQMISILPKYIFEAAFVLGGFLLAAFLFATQDASAAMGMLALFLAAGTRVMPSILRLQGATLGLRSGAATAEPTFNLAARLGVAQDNTSGTPHLSRIRERIAEGHPDFVPTLALSNVSVTYPGASRQAIRDISLTIPAGQSLALVGPSGAGKSTLADVLLGVLLPDAGQVLVGGEWPAAAVARWPGGIAYVPQAIAVATGTVRDNVALGLPEAAVDDELVWKALERAHLAEFLRQSPDGLDTKVGERGVRLSGGQRQRLGIARALYSSPKVLVLDEATSALDAETEEAITSTFAELGGQVTSVVIAHRLSTVQLANQVAYLDHGQVLASGTFDGVRQRVPALERQAQLMGLR